MPIQVCNTFCDRITQCCFYFLEVSSSTHYHIGPKNGLRLNKEKKGEVWNDSLNQFVEAPEYTFTQTPCIAHEAIEDIPCEP